MWKYISRRQHFALDGWRSPWSKSTYRAQNVETTTEQYWKSSGFLPHDVQQFYRVERKIITFRCCLDLFGARLHALGLRPQSLQGISALSKYCIIGVMVISCQNFNSICVCPRCIFNHVQFHRKNAAVWPYCIDFPARGSGKTSETFWKSFNDVFQECGYIWCSAVFSELELTAEKGEINEWPRVLTIREAGRDWVERLLALSGHKFVSKINLSDPSPNILALTLPVLPAALLLHY
jgi:hypothetical protein